MAISENLRKVTSLPSEKMRPRLWGEVTHV